MKRTGFWDVFMTAIWLAWGGLALYLGWFGPWFEPREIDEAKVFWLLLLIWTGLTSVVLFYILFVARTQLHLDEDDAERRLEHTNRRIIALGLIGGFSIAMPALAFTVIGFVAMVPHFNRGFSQQSILTLPNRQQLGISADAKSSYIIGVDVSQSNLPSPGSPKKSRMGDVCSAVSVLLKKEDGIRIVRAQDSFRALVFAGERDDIISQESNYDKDLIRSTFCNTLNEHLKDNGYGRERTNFEPFLDSLEGWASSESEKHENVAIFLFSDFMHEPSPENTESIEATIEKFMTNMRALNNKVRIVGFSMRGVGWQRPGNGVDILPYLERYGMSQESNLRIWNEIPMADFTGAEPSDQWGVFLLNAYRELPRSEPLDLRYRLTPVWKALTSTLMIPEDADHNHLYFSLRPARDGAEAESKVKIKFEDKKGSSPFNIGFGKNGISQFKGYQRRGNSLQVELDDEVEVSPSAQCDLKIAIPSLRVVHSVHLVMFSIIGDLAEPALQLTLKFLSVAVALLAIRASGIPEALGRWKRRRGMRAGL